MTKEQILSLHLTEEQKEQVNRMFTAYERLAGSNPDYPVPFSDCGNSPDVITHEINKKLAEYNKKKQAKEAKQVKAAQLKANTKMIMVQVEAAIASGKTVEDIINAIKNI